MISHDDTNKQLSLPIETFRRLMLPHKSDVGLGYQSWTKHPNTTKNL